MLSDLFLVLIHLHPILSFFGVDATELASWGAAIDQANQVTGVGLFIALLAVILYHALSGLRDIILELTPSTRTMRIVTRGIMVLGVSAFIWGVYLQVTMLAS